jgi:biopolymer transport protein ExbB/TolQ
MSVWVNWCLVVGAISFIIGDLVLEVYASANLATLGLIMLASGILGLALDSAAVGLVIAAVCSLVYLAIHRRSEHMLAKRVSGH